MYYEEVVKLDSKGRITIPAALRLLLGLEDGARLLLVADPDNLKIEIKIVPQDVTVERIIVKESELAGVISKYASTMHAISCYRKTDDAFQCRIVMSALNWDRDKEAENHRSLNDKARDLHRSWSHYIL